MNTYKLDLATKTLIITKAFEEAVNTGKGPEYRLLKQLQRDFRDLTIIRKTHKRPSHYVNKDREITKRNQFKNLSYENMEQFISGLPNNEKYFAEYQYLRDYASKPQRSRYALIRKWFTMQFPRFRSEPLFYLNNTPNTIKAEDIINEEAA